MKKDSFTLIEIIVVIGVIGFVLPALFAIIFGILRQQSRIYNLMEVKRQGDNALVTMENIIKNNALKVYPDEALTVANEVCKNATPPNNVYGPNDGNAFYFKDKAGKYFRFHLNVDKISSDSADSPADLTSSKVIISEFEIKCDRPADYSPPLVSVKFTVNNNPVGQYPMNYYTKIKLKNY